jgi:hypothetical protein
MSGERAFYQILQKGEEHFLIVVFFSLVDLGILPLMFREFCQASFFTSMILELSTSEKP